MTPKIRLFASACITASLAFPLSAQEGKRAPDQEVSGSSISGVRIAVASNGFQLVEHGLWRPANEPTPANFDVGAAARDDFSRRDQHAAGTGTSSFRRASYLPHVYAAEAKYALPPGLLDALVWTESRYNPLAVSGVGAAGLGQLMPATARELGVANRFDPVANIDGAARYLRQMLDRFGVVHLALAAYNAGPGAVRKAGGIPQNGETPAYVRNVLRRWKL
ncbi:lytic transglycosylase domain-containing protein [Alteraurantiacibacter palmitatis]|uniref:Lytic transglycosylase domain-containing protein n=1 Tax=Alteraurantiacibacter palmitatis TaxID=2054628 RepID=A0ABV7E7M6_9SPHN